MKEIRAYKLSNGELVESQEEALRKESKLKMVAKIGFLCQELMVYGMTSEEIADTIIENSIRFRNACGE